MLPTFDELIARAKDSPWKLEFGYTLLAVVEQNGTDYVVGKNDYFDASGLSKQAKYGPITLIDVLDLRFSETLIQKIQSVEEERSLDHTCFFVFGLHALYALLSEGLVVGTLTEKPNGIFEGILELDDKKYAFSVFETERPMEGADFLLVDGSQKPYLIL